MTSVSNVMLTPCVACNMSIMKILVPVDFSPASENALRFAAQLAKRTEAEIHLLNVFHLPNPMATLPIELVITLDELKTDSDSALKKLADATAHETGFPLDKIHLESRNGSTSREIKDYTTYIHADLLVMGMKSNSALREYLVGSSITEIIGKGGTPILVVPEKTEYNAPERFLFATDGHSIPGRKEMDLIKSLSNTFNASVDICHVSDVIDSEQRNQIIGRLEPGFMDIPHEYIFPRVTEIQNGIETIAESQESGMVILIAHPHNWFSKMTGGDHTRSMVFDAKTPLLVMNA
jgi:nucleotide-binding universal stress UspA family protein